MQLRKAIWRTIRDRFPCSKCGQEHKTREHGKSAKLIAAETRSRDMNPRDPVFPRDDFDTIIAETDAEYARGEALDSLV